MSCTGHIRITLCHALGPLLPAFVYATNTTPLLRLPLPTRKQPQRLQGALFRDMAFVNSIRTYSEKRLIGYTREQLFDVVAAVDKYHQFVPACRKSEVVHKSDNYIKANLEIGIPPLLEAYTSNVKLERPKIITASCIEGVLFKHLETRWKFNLPPSVYSPGEVCSLDFHVSFEFKTLLIARLASPIFDEMVRLNVSAFLKRAEKLYGPANKVNASKTITSGSEHHNHH